jgi:hypothetical protein
MRHSKKLWQSLVPGKESSGLELKQASMLLIESSTHDSYAVAKKRAITFNAYSSLRIYGLTTQIHAEQYKHILAK